MTNIVQTPSNIKILNNIFENLKSDTKLKPYYIKDREVNKYFKLDYLSPKNILVLFDTENDRPIKWKESELWQLNDTQNESAPLVNIALLNRDYPLKLISFYIVDDEKYPTRLGVRLYKASRAVLHPFSITFKRVEDWAIYGLDNTNVDVRFTDTNGLHQMAKVSHHLPNLNCALTSYLEYQFPIYKDMRKNHAQLPLTWNEVLINKNKSNIFSKRQNNEVGKKANKRTFLANYSSEYVKRKNIFSEKESNRFENWLSSGALTLNIPEGILNGNKRYVEGVNGIKTFLEELLIYYLKEVPLNKVDIKQDENAEQIIDDTIRLCVRLKKKNISFNFTSIPGLKKYHDDLIYEFNKKTIKSSNVTFKVPDRFLPLVQSLRYKKKLKRLKTPLDLLNEGKKMANCVGSYDNAVKAGRCIIYHYDSPDTGKPYTIEIIIKNERYYIKQHFGKYNKKAATVDLNVISELVKEINDSQRIEKDRK